MSEENKKVVPFQISEEEMQDPETDRLVRESLIREADELEREINRKPELAGIKAPEGMFESIVAELKERGVWEEDEAEPGDEDSSEAIYAQLSEEDRRALTLGRQMVQRQDAKAGKRRRRRKFLKVFGVAAACLVVVFGLSMTSAANRRLVQRMWDGLMIEFGLKINTNYLGEGESVRSKSKEEAEAMETIRKETGAPVIDFGYLPKGMVYQGYEITDGFETVLFYSYQDSLFYVTMADVNEEGSYYYMYDDKNAVFREKLVNKTQIEVEIWEVNLDLDEETYIAEIEYNGWRYVLNGMMPYEEMRKIVEYFMIL